MVDEDDVTLMSAAETAPAITAGSKQASVIVLDGGHMGQMYAVDDDKVLGRGRRADICIRGEGVSRRHARLLLEEDGIVLEDLGSTNGTYVNGSPVERQCLHEGDKIQLGSSVVLKFTYHDELDEDFQRRLYESASRDPLTHAFNKRFFMERLESELSYARRHGAWLAVLMFDFDRFKEINDTHGHPAGDYMLQTTVAQVMQAIRGEDVLARYGGEEFILLSRAAAPSEAMKVGERIRRTIEACDFVFDGVSIEGTVSVGVACLRGAQLDSCQELIRLADAALYRAKNDGRNCVRSLDG